MANNYFVVRQQCPICNSDHIKELVNIPYSSPLLRDYLSRYTGKVDFELLDGVNYIIDECLYCEFIFQRDVPGDYLIGKIYEEWIDPNASYNASTQYGIKQLARTYQDIEKMVVSLNKIPSEIKALDFGMGWGVWARIAKAFGLQTYGVELSEKRIANANSLGISVIKYEEIPDYQFDLINTTQVFEHLSEPMETLKYLTLGVKPNGLIRINVPRDDKIRKKLEQETWATLKWHLKGKEASDSLNCIAPLEHINCYNANSLQLMAQTAGLVPLDIVSSKQAKARLDLTLRDVLRPPYHFLKNHLQRTNDRKNYYEYYIKPEK